MSREAFEAVQANSNASGGELAYLLLAAYRTFDKVRPFRINLSPQELADGLHVSDGMVRRYQRNLMRAGELIEKRAETDKRQRVYSIDLEVPELSYRNHESTGTIVPQSTGTIVPDVVEVPELSYRNRGVDTGTIVPIPAQSIGTNALKYRNYSAVVPYLRETDIETDIETEEKPDALTRDPLSPLPSSVMSADQAFDTLLTYLEGEVSNHELASWKRRVRPAWSKPDVLCLRGPAALVRLQRFIGCMRMATREVGMRAAISFVSTGD